MSWHCQPGVTVLESDVQLSLPVTMAEIGRARVEPGDESTDLRGKIVPGFDENYQTVQLLGESKRRLRWIAKACDMQGQLHHVVQELYLS